MMHVMVVGTTKPQDLQILEGRTRVPYDAAGFDIAIEFRQPDPVPNPPIGDGLEVDWIDAALGSVRVSGASLADLPVGDHPFRLKITDDEGNVEYSPNQDAEPDVWRVVRV